MKANADKIRGQNEEELRRTLQEMEEQLFRLQFQRAMGQVDGLKKSRAMRKERARIYTVLRERQLEKK